MRPLRLTMNAFGPYKGKVEIDFTQLAQSSLFLVSGPTGAGKTTIFDAIAYALFDQASGDARQKDTFKSQFSKDTDLCYVELEFELGEHRYFIHREPTQIGPGTRSKTKQIQSNIEFHHHNQVTTKVSEANNEIQQLVGLTYDQFRQIVMLPQGAFKKMLESDSGEKEKIFRNIFQTDLIEQFQESLKNQAKTLADDRKSYEQAMKQAFSNIAKKDNEELTKAIEQFDLDRILEILQETITKEETELSDTKSKLNTLQITLKSNEQIIGWLDQQETYLTIKEKLESEKEQVEQKEVSLLRHLEAEKVLTAKTAVDETEKQIRKQQTELENLTAQQTDLNKKEKEASEQLASIKTAVDQLQKTRDAITKLNDELKVFSQIEEKQKEIKKQESIIEETEQSCAHLAEQLKEHKVLIEKTEKELLLITKLRDRIEELQKVIAENNESLYIISTHKEQLEIICDLQKEESEVKGKVEEAKETEDRACFELAKGKAAYYTNLANILAEELKEDEACPVCGSTHHPEVAEAVGHSISREDLKTLELKEKEAATAHTRIAAKLESLTQDVQTRCERLDIEPAETESAFQEQLAKENSLKKELATVENELETAKKQASKESDLKQKWETVCGQEQNATAELQKCRSTIEFAQTRQSELTQEKKQLEKELTVGSKPEIEKEIKEKQSYIEKTEAEHEQLQAAVSSLKSDLSSTKTAIEMTTAQLKELTEKKDSLSSEFEQIKASSGLGDEFLEYVLEDHQQAAFKEEVETYKQAALVNQDRIDQVEANLQTVDSLKLKIEYEEESVQIKTQTEELEHKRDELVSCCSQNKRAEEDIRRYRKQSEEIEQKYQLVGELSRLANGAKETDYISFERYVLGIYFEEILLAANQRFSQMTNHRYELQRQIERGKGAGKQGLDMEVFDHYTGKKRSVHTLSGGETFKASLALALGLSDVIQNQNGGVSVDTLFVDEGFGTLDSDSLDMAVQTLLDLHQKGRLVGIISHVDELKTRIPAHIVVEKTATGSTAYIQN